ncbi:hypothetical protein K7887_08380 [Sutcliffiella horikoshii]|uniref:DUF6612 family protein n=1 Tax=Sutcliffiella horikoshii TaxID=79883 RepID=UPI001CBD9F90|nr:DUF6612 family protein [Sutcliffiella horikoshii]UAL48934.1 hypothetical protein K7887_08380 [Sutcliffiella horikoshii]
MKSLKMMLVGILAVMLLTACGNSSNGASGNTEGNAEAEESTNEETTNATTEVEEVDASEETDTEEQEEMTADEVLQKSTEAMAGLSSYSMEMISDQEISMAGEDTIKMVTTTTTDMSLNPMAMYQVTSIEDADGMMEGMENESYFSEDGFFIYDSMAGQWFKMPEEFTAQLNAMSEMQTNPAEQLEMLKDYTDEITMTEEEGHYVLNFEGSGEQFNEMAGMIGGMMGDDMGEMMQEMLSMMTVNQLNYLVHIDKESFYQTKVLLNMDMEMDVDGEKVSSIQVMDSTLTNFDEVGEITVPQEVIDSAQEISEEDLEQMEQQGSY